MKTRVVKGKYGDAETRELPESFTDKAGREVRRGDTIVYGHALGRCAGLKFGKVLDIEKMPEKQYGSSSEWSIQVQGVDDDWSHRPTELSKPGRLNFPSRIVKVDHVPEPVAALLAALIPAEW